MPQTRLLLLLLMVCLARSSLHYNFYKAESIFSCLKEALEEAKRRSFEENSILSKRGYDFGPSDNLLSKEEEEEEEDEKEKRTFPAARYRYLSQAQVKGNVYQNKAKSNRRTKFTLSLDVPTNLMNILFDIAKARNMRAKAAANAQLMAQIGRRK
ncbi:PREDICTED: urocortin-3 [Nanorana parkeri]|uniref:urocortin-3 n=1 Tax=Nanorana parkeri TaxID=125878 RepID=UPI000854AC55|nr:PREDICTED: urocortin-3 [Nanorana parkeri]